MNPVDNDSSGVRFENMECRQGKWSPCLVLRAAPGNPMSELLNALQWPAMAITLTAAWMVSSRNNRKRRAGFWCFIASNVCWISWAWFEHAYALIVMQLGLFAMNVRGTYKN